MSSNYNQYGGYSGNPYESTAQSNPYGGNAYGSNTTTTAGYGSSNPYGGGYNTGAYGQTGQGVSAPAQQSYGAQQQQHGYDGAVDPTGQASRTEYVQAGASVLSDKDFLSQVEGIKKSIRELTTNVDNIATLHQQSLNSTDARGSGPLESLVTDTQVKNTLIKDQIKKLEVDAARSRGNQIKDTQVRQLKTSFQNQLQLYRQEEAKYEQRYREQIARQYRIVNPEATEAEVQEASQADWGNEGVFQTALKSNRTAAANTVLGAVRARHNDIQQIEKTMMELNRLMEDLATAVVLQDAPVQQIEQHTHNVQQDTEAGNKQLDKGIRSARNARKMKWICFWICVAIVIILALILGLYFGLPHAAGRGN